MHKKQQQLKSTNFFPDNIYNMKQQMKQVGGNIYVAGDASNLNSGAVIQKFLSIIECMQRQQFALYEKLDQLQSKIIDLEMSKIAYYGHKKRNLLTLGRKVNKSKKKTIIHN